MDGRAGKFTLEVCVDSLDDAVAAEKAGADRLELNAALPLGGLTPSAGLVESVLQECDCDVVAMLRPRGAGFRYTPSELRVMRRDAERLRDQGIRTIAFGVLTPERDIDGDACLSIMEHLEPVEFVFHRAFDCVRDPYSNFETLVELGFIRLLSSGGRATAVEGTEIIASLQERNQGRITIMPGSGITPANLRHMIEATGCSEFHGSFSRTVADLAEPVADNYYRRVDAQAVAAARSILSER